VSFPIVHSLLSLLLGFCQLDQLLDVIRNGELNLTSISFGGADELVHFISVAFEACVHEAGGQRNFAPVGV